jgi:virginiamycin B lyase
MENNVNRPRFYALATCVALSAAGCGGGSGGPAAALPRTQLEVGAPNTGSRGIAEYPIPTSHKPTRTYPIGITTGPDGAIWFAERGLGRLGSITTHGQFPNSIRLRGVTPARFPQNIALGPDGNLWATCGTLNTYRQQSHGDPDPYGAIMRVSTTGTMHQFPLQTMDSDPRGIASGPDGKLWFTEARGAVGNITTDGVIEEANLPKNNAAFPIAVGPDQNLWFGESFNSRIGRVKTDLRSVKTDLRIKIFKLPKKDGPYGIVSGSYGNLYATLAQTASVAQINTMGVITAEWALSKGSYPKGIALGSDGNLYVAEFDGSSIGEIVLTGSKPGMVIEFPTPTPNSGPWGITSGPDGNIWFTESLTGKIGELVVNGH